MPLRFLIPCAMLLLLTACASLDPGVQHDSGLPDTSVSDIPELADDDTVPGWHSIAFMIDWPDNQGPAWHVDTFLAHTVCRDILNAYGSDIVLWRFHRRAVRDATGHRFSFKFYGDQALARKIHREIENHPIATQLLASGVVTAINYGPADGKRLPNIGDTSDPAWSEPLQASWPYFAMGVSQAWLELINQVVQSSSPMSGTESLNERLDFYLSVNNEVTGHWRLEGRHAYLHHLNALFGYQEFLLRDGQTTRF